MLYQPTKSDQRAISRFMGQSLPLLPLTQWTLLKQAYPNTIVLLKFRDLHFSFGIDALILHNNTRLPLCDNPCIYCWFPAAQLDDILSLLTPEGLSIALCDDPDSTDTHVFI